MSPPEHQREDEQDGEWAEDQDDEWIHGTGKKSILDAIRMVCVFCPGPTRTQQLTFARFPSKLLAGVAFVQLGDQLRA